MRLKLVFIASLVAAVIGAGAYAAAVYWTLGPMGLNPQFSGHSPRWLGLLAPAPPVLLALCASYFVYRHTARRRRLQAALTVLLAIAFSLALHVAAFFLYRP